MTAAKTKTASKAIDLNDLNTSAASDQGAEFELLHPVTQKPLGIFITVLGKHSEVFRNHIKDNINDRLRKAAMSERTGKRQPVATAEQTEREAVELMVLCTLGWRYEEGGKPNEPGPGSINTLTHKGEELTFSVTNATTLYSELIWMREQVDAAIGDLELFIKA